MLWRYIRRYIYSTAYFVVRKTRDLLNFAPNFFEGFSAWFQPPWPRTFATGMVNMMKSHVRCEKNLMCILCNILGLYYQWILFADSVVIFQGVDGSTMHSGSEAHAAFEQADRAEFSTGSHPSTTVSDSPWGFIIDWSVNWSKTCSYVEY